MTTPGPSVWGRLDADGPVDPDGVEARTAELLGQLTLDERCSMTTGDQTLRGAAEMARHYNRTPIVAGRIDRLGIPGIRFSDGPRGVVMDHGTAYPCSMARGATFDPALEEQVGDAIGVECRALGANLFAGVCVNVLRHPAWGRAQETYGEDPWLLGEMGAALTRGAQRHVMACVKHFALNSMENARFKVDVRVDEADLRDLYLPHFRRIVDEGVAAVMSAYNKVNGQWAGHHHHLLTTILKQEWGFDGFVMSDFVLGVRNAADALAGGQDLEMPFRWRFRRLRRLIDRGLVSESRVDDAVRRIVGQQVRFAGRGEPDRYTSGAVGGDQHRALARLVAERSIVLLQNGDRPAQRDREGVEASGDRAGPLLPLGDHVSSVAVIGRLADLANTGDHGSSWVRARDVVTPLAGLRAAAADRGVAISYDDGSDSSAAAAVAAAADVAVVVVGYTYRDEGEFLFAYGGDRAELTLRVADEALIARVAAAQPDTVVVMEGGSAIVTERWRETVPALVMAWYPGVEGGHALAAVLFGDVDPGGRLPCTFPRSARQLPPFDRRARKVEYGPLFGYRLFEASGEQPAFPFGHGLSYTTWEYGPPMVERTEDGGITATVEVTNTGSRAGTEVVQVYVDEVLGSHPQALRTLRGAARIEAGSGETITATITVAGPDLDRPGAGRALRVHVGSSWAVGDLQTVSLSG